MPAVHAIALLRRPDRSDGRRSDRTRFSRYGIAVRHNARVTVENQKRVLALLLGLVTIAAGFFSWRAGQIGSTAAFDDRQAIGQTIKQEEQNVEVALFAATDAVSYVRYLADYAEAATLDDDAAALSSAGEAQLAAVRETQADDLRRGATVRAAKGGVFGAPAVFGDVLEPQPAPRQFDLQQHLGALRAELSTDIRSPGPLDPDKWAQEAEDIRVRMRGLRVGVFILVIAAAALTVAQVATRSRARYAFGAFGILLGLATTAVTVAAVY